MLPTHLVHQVHSSTTTTGGGDQVMSGSGGSGRMQYPPERPTVEVASNGSSSSSSNSSSTGKRKLTSIQNRICGPRGVTSLTVETETPHRKASDDDTPLERIHAEANIVATKSAGNASRWNTWEFYVYAIVFFFAVPWMIKVPMNLSLGKIYSRDIGYDSITTDYCDGYVPFLQRPIHITG